MPSCKLPKLWGCPSCGCWARRTTQARLPRSRFPAPTTSLPFACGLPILAVEDTEGAYVTAADTNAHFCLTAKGDSMISSRIYDGDEVFIQQTDVVENGEIAAVVVDGEATLKRVYYYPEEQKLILEADNPAYRPLVFTGPELETIHILGRAVAFQSKLR